MERTRTNILSAGEYRWAGWESCMRRLASGITCAAVFVVLFATPHTAVGSWTFMNSVTGFYDGGQGGSYGGLPDIIGDWENGNPIAGPYGGWYDGEAHTSKLAHPGYVYTIPMSGSSAAVTNSGIYSPFYFVNSIGDAIFHYGPLDPSPYVFVADPQATVAQPASFLSLPGTATPNSPLNSYVTVAVSGMGIAPGDTNPDILITGLYHAGTEQARVWGRTATGPFLLIGTAQATTSHSDSFFDLSGIFSEPVVEFKIEGMDLEGESFGYDLTRVMYQTDSSVPVSSVPEPATVVLLISLGAAGLVYRLVRRRTR